MKSLIIFYTTCIIILYSTIAYIGYRNKNYGDLKNGVLAEITVSAPEIKVGEAKLLAGHFDCAIKYLNANQLAEASQQIYAALMVLTIKEVSSGNYDKKLLKLTLKNLSACCVNLKRGKEIKISSLNKLFECSELVLAQDYMLKAEKDISKNKLANSMKDVNLAEECILYAQRFAYREDIGDIKRNREIFNDCNYFSKLILRERESNFWKKMLIKIDNYLEGSAG